MDSAYSNIPVEESDILASVDSPVTKSERKKSSKKRKNGGARGDDLIVAEGGDFMTTDGDGYLWKVWTDKLMMTRIALIFSVITFLVVLANFIMLISLGFYVYNWLVPDIEEEILEQVDERIHGVIDELICVSDGACVSIMTALMGPYGASVCNLGGALTTCSIDYNTSSAESFVSSLLDTSASSPMG